MDDRGIVDQEVQILDRQGESKGCCQGLGNVDARVAVGRSVDIAAKASEGGDEVIRGKRPRHGVIHGVVAAICGNRGGVDDVGEVPGGGSCANVGRGGELTQWGVCIGAPCWLLERKAICGNVLMHTGKDHAVPFWLCPGFESERGADLSPRAVLIVQYEC